MSTPASLERRGTRGLFSPVAALQHYHIQIRTTVVESKMTITAEQNKPAGETFHGWLWLVLFSNNLPLQREISIVVTL